LAFLAESIIEGDTWRTFMAFSEAWARRSWQTEKLEKHLPRFPEAFEDDLNDDIQSDNDDLLRDTKSPNHIEERLAEMLATLTAKTDDAETHLVEVVGKAAARITISQENLIEAIDALKMQGNHMKEQCTDTGPHRHSPDRSS
jgi:hypothetical protein